MGTADRTRQYLSAYRSAFVVGVVGIALVTTAGIAEDNRPPPAPRVVSDGHTVTPPPMTVTVTATPSGIPVPSPSGSASPSELPTVLPSELPSSVPPSIASPIPTFSATPTLTPSPTPTPRNHANGLTTWCIVAVDHHGDVIKRPCKEQP